jgi:glutamate racemase
VQSASYVIEIEKFFPAVRVTQEACPMWVPLVENNDYKAEGADYFVDRNIRNLMQKDPAIDTILLACTHYPLLIDKIRAHTPQGVTVIQQGEIISSSLVDYLHRHQEVANRCSNGAKRHFYTTGDAASFNEHGSLFYGQDIDSQHIVIG